MSRQTVRTEEINEVNGMKEMGFDGGNVWHQDEAAAAAAAHHHRQQRLQQQNQQQEQYMLNFAGSQQVERSWDVQKTLHLYIYEYCLKHNHIKAANAFAEETRIRTDEGVPFAADSVDGLLLDWFTAFWQNFAGSSKSATETQSKLQPQQVQQRSAFTSTSPTSSTFMRRTETEPIMRLPVAARFTSADLLPMHRSSSQGHHPTPQKSTEAYMSSSVGSQQTIAMPPSAGRTSRDTAFDAMQKMGWGNRSIDTLSGDEKSKLVTVLKRSQLAQHQALQRMAVTHQNTSLEASANRGSNGSVFQQERSPTDLSNQEHIRHRPGSPDQKDASHQSSTTAHGPIKQHKKQRKSVKLSSLSKIQQLQRQQPASKKERLNSIMPVGITNALEMGLEPSPKIKDHNASVPTSASQNQITSPLAKTETAHQAQSQVASQMTMRLDAQIAQMQNQMHQGSSAANKINSQQIFKLQALQGKLQQQQQQQQQHQHSRSFSDMGPPPPNPPTPALTSNNSFHSDHMTPEWGRQPATPLDQYDAMHQQQQSHPSVLTVGKTDSTFKDIDFNNFDWSSLDTSSVL